MLRSPGLLRAPATIVLALILGSAVALSPAAAAAQEGDATLTAEAAPPDATGAAEVDADVDGSADASADLSTTSGAEVGVEPVAEAEVDIAPPATEPDGALAAQLRAREEMATIHRAFGVATWLSMAVTAVFGWIQFADEYGFHGSEADTACANQTAVFNDFCTGVPWVHAISGFTTAALYFTTAGLSLAMPAPLEASEDVEIHKTLRWFHLATMLATAVFGVVTANVEADFETRQALALVHQGLGVTTFGLLTAAAAVVVF